MNLPSFFFTFGIIFNVFNMKHIYGVIVETIYNKENQNNTLLRTSFTLILAAMLYTFTACGHSRNEGEQKEVIDSFSTAYYNWQFKKALKYCTPESEKFIKFAATNVHQADIDILRAQDDGAGHDINDITYPNDTMAIVTITVNNYLRMDTIGCAGKMIKHAQFTLNMRYRNSKWMVHLINLPQKNKISH